MRVVAIQNDGWCFVRKMSEQENRSGSRHSEGRFFGGNDLPVQEELPVEEEAYEESNYQESSY